MTTNVMDEEVPPVDTDSEMKKWLRVVEDPELHMPIVDLGLIYECTREGQTATVKMTLTSAACPAGDYLVSEVKSRMKEHPSIQDADVQLVWEPAWDPKTMATEEVRETLGIW